MPRIVRILLAASALVAAGCAGDARTQIVVSAAASLTDVFADMESAFEGANPGIDVVMNLAGSSLLAEQIIDGAPIDVFAPADPEQMDRVAAEVPIAGAPAFFASNGLQVATPADNPGDVDALDDLSNSALLVGLCDPSVPCGMLAREALAEAGLEASVDSNEPNVRSLLTKITEGELDAGIVYVTDVLASGGRVRGIAMPLGVDVRAQYPIAAVAHGPNPGDADLFVEFVLSAEGQAILAEHGFEAP